MRVLYIAMSCTPFFGSENVVGWNIATEMVSRGHDVMVLTRSDTKPEIDKYIAEHPGDWPEFRYAPLSAFALRCKGPLYSLRAKLWCEGLGERVRELCEEFRPDVVHQVTPVEFRSVVDLTGVDVVKVLGPVGGGEGLPFSLRGYLGPKDRFMEAVRSAANFAGSRGGKLRRVCSSYDVVMATNVETRETIEPLCRVGVGLRPEVTVPEVLSAKEPTSKRNGEELVIGFAGRLVYRKGLALLLDALAETECPVRLLVAGVGPERERLEARASGLGIGDRVDFLGRVPHEDMVGFYRDIDLFAFPSLREATGSVLAEAVAAGVPVMSLGICGANVVLSGNPDFLIDCGGVVRCQGASRTGHRGFLPRRNLVRLLAPRRPHDAGAGRALRERLRAGRHSVPHGKVE